MGRRVGVHVVQTMSNAMRSRHAAVAGHIVQVVARPVGPPHAGRDVLASYAGAARARAEAGRPVNVHATAPLLHYVMGELYGRAGVASTGMIGVFLAMALCREAPHLFGFTTLETSLSKSEGLPHYGGKSDMEVSLDVFARNAAWLHVHGCLGLLNVSGCDAATATAAHVAAHAAAAGRPQGPHHTTHHQPRPAPQHTPPRNDSAAHRGLDRGAPPPNGSVPLAAVHRRVIGHKGRR